MQQWTEVRLSDVVTLSSSFTAISSCRPYARRSADQEHFGVQSNAASWPFLSAEVRAMLDGDWWEPAAWTRLLLVYWSTTTTHDDWALYVTCCCDALNFYQHLYLFSKIKFLLLLLLLLYVCNFTIILHTSWFGKIKQSMWKHLVDPTVDKQLRLD